MHTINLVVGDHSGDGHERRDTYTISSNLNIKEVREAYSKAVGIIGFNFIDEVAVDYTDSSLPEDKHDILEAHGILDGVQYDGKDDRTDDKYGVWVDSHKDIYLNLIKLGNPGFTFEEIEGADINIGGYGLYY